MPNEEQIAEMSRRAAAGEGAESGEEMAGEPASQGENGGLMVADRDAPTKAEERALRAAQPETEGRSEAAVRVPDEPLLKFFVYGHLPEHLRAISAPFGIMARRLVEQLPRNPERTVALRKLLESKDCAVRALLS